MLLLHLPYIAIDCYYYLAVMMPDARYQYLDWYGSTLHDILRNKPFSTSNENPWAWKNHTHVEIKVGIPYLDSV